MTPRPSALPSDSETIAELRELYRAAEARAARLRLLSVSGRELAKADEATLGEVLKACAERLAFFAGRQSAEIAPAARAGIAVRAPGPDGVVVARLVIPGLEDLASIPDAEDREALRMQLELMGTTIHRIERERERSELLAALQERERRLALMLEKVFTAQEEERRRVSHELHDGLAQTATALVRLLEGAEHDLAAATAPAPKEVARGLVSELRRVIAGLRPTLLDDLGLLAALQSLGEGLAAGGFAVRMELGGEDARLAPLVETALFRVAQEATANIHKHSGGPCAVTIEARLASDPILLRITDEGCGPALPNRGHEGGTGHRIGIDVMNERMTALGGTLDWRGEPGRGVTVEARLPRGSLA